MQVIERHSPSVRGRVAVWLVVWALFGGLLSGCQSPSRVVTAQLPGSASGAGATLTGPANSAAPSNQTARRTVVYFPPARSETDSAESPRAVAPGAAVPGRDELVASPAAAVAAPPAPLAPAAPIAWVSEETTTQLGAHQDVSAIVQAAGAAARWGWLRWIGILCILGGVAGWLWSVGNPLGYPLVFLGIAGCGVVFVFASANPAWLLLIGLPVAFFGLQQLGVLRPRP